MPFCGMASVFLKATLAFGGVLLVRRFFRNGLSATLRYRIVFSAFAFLPLLAAVELHDSRSALSVLSEPRNASYPSAYGEFGSLKPPALPALRRIRVPKAAIDLIAASWTVVAAALLMRGVVSRVMVSARVRRFPICRNRRWTAPFARALASYGMPGNVRLLEGYVDAPFSVGLFHPAIVVPVSGFTSDAHRYAAILHELAHLRRRDIQSMAFTDLSAAVFWGIPLLRRALRVLDEDREEACDSMALRHGADPAGYAELILELAAGERSAFADGAAGMLGGAKIERRIRAILRSGGMPSSTHPRRSLTALAAAAALLLAIAWVGVPELFAVEGAGAGSLGIRTMRADGVSTFGLFSLAELPRLAPLGGDWTVTQSFGEHAHPLDGRPYLHYGVDLSNGRAGAPVLCTIDGRIVDAGSDAERGNYVEASDGALTVRFYKLQERAVQVGTRVSAGTKVGTVGSTGVSTGPHLHYEIWLRGAALDPAPALRAADADYRGL